MPLALSYVENGTWAAMAGKMMAKQLEEMKNITLLSPTLYLKSALKEGQVEQLEELADMIAKSL